MIIKNISIVNTRKIESGRIEFSKNTNIIIGANGTGKTTILEAIYFLLTTKSFRKKANQNIITNNKKELQIQAETQNNKEKFQTKLTYNKNKKIFEINKQKTKKTSEVLYKNSVVSASPEEANPIEGYRKERLQYFDKIIFKTNPNYIENIKKYNKLIVYRKEAFLNNQNPNIWNQQIAEEGIKIWKKRKDFYNIFCKEINKAQQEISNKQTYTLEYTQNATANTDEYKTNLKKNQKKEQTTYGPHTDKIRYYKNNKNLKDQASQGEKKLFLYLLKLAEAEFLYINKKNKPILLLDDFVAKLDNKNIMKIFTYFHCKFQTVITTTKEDGWLLKKSQKNSDLAQINIIDLNDKIKQVD